MHTIVLSVLALCAAALTIRAEYKGPRLRVYVLKPLATFLVLLVALLRRSAEAGFYRWWLVAGLGLSLVGDVLLMLPGDRFAAGLGSFLLAHVCYIGGFSLGTKPSFSAIRTLPYVLYAVALLWVLLPHTGGLRIPVLVYGLAITAMAWWALQRWAVLGTWSALSAAVGAGLFVISDSALALDRFVRRYSGARGLVLGAYYVGQWLIALSV